MRDPARDGGEVLTVYFPRAREKRSRPVSTAAASVVSLQSREVTGWRGALGYLP